jgi:hypothetical protein
MVSCVTLPPILRAIASTRKFICDGFTAVIEISSSNGITFIISILDRLWPLLEGKGVYVAWSGKAFREPRVITGRRRLNKRPKTEPFSTQ